MFRPSRPQPSPSRAERRPGAAKNYTPPKTAWGDPDLQGNYTNKDESGIPFERPSEFEGKKIDDVADAELAELVKERAAAAAQRAPGIGGADTGAGPMHWYENYDAKNSRPWLVIDPADGRIPPMTPEAQARIAAMPPARSSFTGGPWDSPADFSLYDRCITRGVPGSMMPAIYGNSYQIVQAPGYVAIRYEMIHETRIIPLDGRPHVGPSVRPLMGDARGHFEGETLVVETTNFNPRSDLIANANSDTYASSSASRRSRRTRWNGRSPRRSEDVDEAVDVCDEPDEGREPAAVRVRVPRRELRVAEHPERARAGRQKATGASGKPQKSKP